MTSRSAEASSPVPVSTALVYAPFFPPATDGGGPIRSLSAFVVNAPTSWTLSVATSDRDLGAADRLTVPSNIWSSWRDVPTLYASVDRLRGLFNLWQPILTRTPDVLYVNSFFNWKFSLVPQLVTRLARPRVRMVVATRGEMGAGALGRRNAKKVLLLTLYRALRLHRRVVFHASSEMERRDIERSLGSDIEVLVRRNETLLPPTAQTSQVPPDSRIVFVGRVVPHKGLELLLQALTSVSGSVRLDVFGAEEDRAYAARCRDLADASRHDVTFHGSTEHGKILEAVRAATLLALPTAGENFGHVIVESLSVGCPVVVADTTPWSARLLEHGGGVVVDQATPEAWAQAVSSVLSLVPEEQTTMRQRAADAYDSWQEEAGPHLLDLLS